MRLVGFRVGVALLPVTHFLTNLVYPFTIRVIDREILRYEWQKWLRALTIYLEAEGTEIEKQKRSKLLLLGGVQL